MRIEGHIEVGEASAYAGRACAPLRSGPHPFVAGLLLTLGVFGVAYLLFVGADLLFRFPDSVAAFGPFGLAFAAFIAGWNLARKIALRRTRTAYETRGLVSPVSSAVEISSGQLVVSTGRMTMTAPWPAVSDLFPAGPYWVILIEGYSHFLPRRFFASPAEEAAFLALLLDRMAPDARARCPEAVAMARG